MKKVGIITFHNTTNYGALLQAIALQKKIRELGAECETIDYRCPAIESREGYSPPSFTKNLYQYMCIWKNYFTQTRKRKIIKGFAKKHLATSKRKYNSANIAQSNNEYDVFITGSDMVWELGITQEDYAYYLDFADHKKRFSYAASLGVDKISSQYRTNCIEEWKKYQCISVREIQARDLIVEAEPELNELIRVDVDPTLLLDAKTWKKFEKIPHVAIPQKYVLLYFLDSDGIMLKSAKQIASESNAEIIVLSDKKLKIKNCNVVQNASVGEFLYYLEHAFLVITGSYHGMLFSMNFNTNFMYFNRANSTRMESIATLTDAKSRRLQCGEIPAIECDFSEINRRIAELRKESEKYLKRIIM